MNTHIQLVNYRTHQEILHRIRYSVFVEEQGVPASLEVDPWDPLSIHALAFYQEEPIATGRLLPDGHIGRVAVLKSMRHKGFGTRIMERLIRAARQQGHNQTEISAQCHAVCFYRRLGFREEGQIYQEAGIDHIKMVKPLKSPQLWQPEANFIYAPSIGAARL